MSREIEILTPSPAAALRRDDRVTLKGPRTRRRRRAERQSLIRCAVAAYVEVEACVGGLDCGALVSGCFHRETDYSISHIPGHSLLPLILKNSDEASGPMTATEAVS